MMREVARVNGSTVGSERTEEDPDAEGAQHDGRYPRKAWPTRRADVSVPTTWECGQEDGG
jgi:hypothetical protein